MVHVTKTQTHPSHHNQPSPSPSPQSQQPVSSNNQSPNPKPKRGSLFGGLARRRQSTDDYSESSHDSKRRSSSSSSSPASPTSPPPLPTSPPPQKTHFNPSQPSQLPRNTNQWPSGPQSLDGWVSRAGTSSGDGTLQDGDQEQSHSQGRAKVGGTSSSSVQGQLNLGQDGSHTIFGADEWDSMQYVLDRVEDGSMINSTDSPPKQFDPSYSSSNDSEQPFPLGRVSLDLLVHDPSSTKPFAGVQPRPRQDSAPQLAHSRHRSHFSIPDVVVTAAEEEGQGQHFEVKVPAGKRRSFVLNVHNPQIHSMPTNNGTASGGPTPGFPKKAKGQSKLKPLIRLDSPVAGTSTAFSGNANSVAGNDSYATGSSNSSANSTLSKGSGISSATSSSSSSANTTIASNRKGKKTFSLFGRKIPQSSQQQQPASPITASPTARSFYSSPHDSSGSLPTSSASGAESSKESLVMKSKEANQSSASPPTSNSSDGESSGGFNGLSRGTGAGGVPNFNIPSSGVPAPALTKGNATSPSSGSFTSQPATASSVSPHSSSPIPSSTTPTMSSPPKKLTKKEQKLREKQELDLIKQVEKVDKMVRQHDEKEKKREKKEREKMRKNGTLDSIPSSQDGAPPPPSKPQSKIRRLTIFSARSKAGPAAAIQQAQVAAIERRNSSRRTGPRPTSNKGKVMNAVSDIHRDDIPQQQHGSETRQQARENDPSGFSFPPRPPQQISGSPPSTLNRPRPPRTRPQQLPMEEQRNGPAPPTIVLTSPSSPVRTSFSEAYPQPSSLPSDELKAKDGASVERPSQEWQDLTSPTEATFPLSEGAGNVPWNGKSSDSQKSGLNRSTSLQRALAYTHAEEGMIRKKASLRRRGSKRSVGSPSGSARNSLVDSDSTPTGVPKRPSFLRKGSGNISQVEDEEWEEEGEGNENRPQSLSSDNVNANDGSITPRAGNSSPSQSVTPQGRSSPSNTNIQINQIPPPVSFSRPFSFSRPPPAAPPQPPSPTRVSSINAEPYTDAMSHIISATPPLEAAKIRARDRNGSVSSNSTGGSSGSSNGSPRKYQNGRKDDHFIFPIPVRSATLESQKAKSSENDFGTAPLPRSSSTPQYF